MIIDVTQPPGSCPGTMARAIAPMIRPKIRNRMRCMGCALLTPANAARGPDTQAPGRIGRGRADAGEELVLLEPPVALQPVEDVPITSARRPRRWAASALSGGRSACRTRRRRT